jgi:spoIIIJ-associated protein
MNETFSSEELSLIEEHVRRLLGSMGFDTIVVNCRHCADEVEDIDQATTNHRLSITINAGDEGRLLIGNHGQHLSALQYVLRSVLKRHLATNVLISLDINNYRARREQNLASLAEASARRAKNQGQTVILSPMNAFDRRAIHTALASWEGVKTESVGEEPNRRIVIRPSFF